MLEFPNTHSYGSDYHTFRGRMFHHAFHTLWRHLASMPKRALSIPCRAASAHNHTRTRHYACTPLARRLISHNQVCHHASITESATHSIFNAPLRITCSMRQHTFHHLMRNATTAAMVDSFARWLFLALALALALSGARSSVLSPVLALARSSVLTF